MLEKKEIQASYIANTDNCEYLLIDGIPIVLVIDIRSKEVLKCIRCPEGEYSERSVFSGMYIYDNRIVLVPHKAKQVWIFDLSKECWRGLDISFHICPDEERKFLGGRLESGILYMFGYRYNGILSVNLDTLEIKSVLKEEDCRWGFNGTTSVTKNGFIYIPMRHENRIIRIEAKTKHYNVIDLSIDSELPNDGIAYGENSFYLLKNSGNVLYRIQEDFSRIDKLFFDDSFADKNNYFDGIEYYAGRIIFFGTKDTGCVYDLNDNRSFVFKESIFFVKKISPTELLVCKKGRIELWDTDMNVVIGLPLAISEKDVSKYLKEKRMNCQLFYEDDLFALKEMLFAVCEKCDGLR